MAKKKAQNKTRDFQATANIISQVYDVIENFDNQPDYYSPAARKLASKIIAEWAKDLKDKSAKLKRPKKSDLQLAAFLEGYSKFLI